jgi:CBS domain-containing protein
VAKVREVMKTTLYSVDPSTTVGEAISLMAQNRIGSALIMEGGQLIGIFTERDTVRAISQSHDAPTHEISSWMTRDPKTVSPDLEVDEAMKLMLDHGFRHLPVMEGKEVVGMISMRDLAASEQKG